MQWVAIFRVCDSSVCYILEVLCLSQERLAVVRSVEVVWKKLCQNLSFLKEGFVARIKHW